MKNNYITLLDFLLIILFAIIIMGVAHGVTQKWKYPVIRKYFMQGILLKLISSIGFGWVYVYYYGGGDTQMYFDGASNIFNAFVFEGRGVDAFFSYDVLSYGSQSTRFTQRIAGLINIFALNSFWSCTMLFGALSFIGQWLLFISFFRIFPKLHKQLAIATLFIPGVLFWSSGIMKDSLCMLCVGIVVYTIQNLFLFNKKKALSAFWLLLGFYFIINLKAYIALSLLVAIALYLLVVVKNKIKNPSTKALVLPLAAVVIFGGALLAMGWIGASLQRYSLENIVETAETYQTYHARTSLAGRGGSDNRTGSAYTLGDVDFNSPLNIISKFPLAVNVTFFRPYIWEVKSPVMFLSALESFILMIFTFKVIRNIGMGGFFKSIFSNKEVLFCMTFSLIFGFAVGFTTYNFGSLVRYKAPCVPFFIIALIIINNIATEKKKESFNKKASKLYSANQSTVVLQR